MRRATATAAVLLFGAAIALTGCSDAGGPRPTTAATARAASSSASATPVPLTCANMIPASTVKAFTAAGWSPAAGPLYVGDVHVAKGLQCTWGRTSSERTEIFGRGPIDGATAKDAEQQLAAQGWRRIDSPDGVYITAGKDMILDPDDEGYGMTYLFGDGWVKVSSTKQGIVLIADPS